MALSEELQAASDALDTVENESVPTPYNRVEITALVDAVRSIITVVDELQNP